MTLVQRLWDRARPTFGHHRDRLGRRRCGLWCGGLHLIALRPLPNWETMTGLAISVLVISSLVLLVAVPPFLRLRGHVASLEEIMTTTSIAERRRRRAEGDEAAAALGAAGQSAGSVS
ncbi:MAG: hypothetical protein CM15mP128_1390 [Methanobacteriota archaeon]|nr:MAG: hypothetical protein CM15mP128_1390 [Euryarchaeota archaeon]